MITEYVTTYIGNFYTCMLNFKWIVQHVLESEVQKPSSLKTRLDMAIMKIRYKRPSKHYLCAEYLDLKISFDRSGLVAGIIYQQLKFKVRAKKKSKRSSTQRASYRKGFYRKSHEPPGDTIYQLTLSRDISREIIIIPCQFKNGRYWFLRVKRGL